MMKNYSVKRLGTDPGNGEHFGIFEHQTEQVIMQCKDQFHAQVVKTKLNNGAGFDGWTPAFMVRNNFSKRL